MTERTLPEDEEPGDLYCPESLRLAMFYAAIYWPGVTISDGAFDVLRQVAEYRNMRRTKP